MNQKPNISKAARSRTSLTSSIERLSSKPKSKVATGIKFKKKNEELEEEGYEFGLLGLFRFANKTDNTILFIGILSSIIHGASFPVLAVVFGQMTNAFIAHADMGRNGSFHTQRSGFQPFPNENQESEQSSWSTFNFDSLTKVSSQSHSNEEFLSYLANYSLNYLYIGVIVLVAAFIQTLCWETACERQVHQMRLAAFKQILRQDMTWYDVRKSTNLANVLSDDAERVREGIGCKFSMVTQYMSTFITGSIVGVIVNWKLTAVLLLIAPIVIGSSAFLAKLTASSAAREQLKYGQAGLVAEEVLSCIRIVAAFSAEDKEVIRYEKALETGLQLAMSKYLVLSWGLTVVFFVMYAQYAVAFYYGSILLNDGYCSAGSIFTVFFSVLIGSFTLGNALPYVNSVANAFGAAQSIFRIVDRVPLVDPYSDIGLSPSTVRGHIQFRNVHFSYPSRLDALILNNVNLDIEPGKTVALVGPSGSGKSTVMNLLLRMYDPSLGEIRLDGRPLEELNVSWLRSKIGVVHQEPVLFGVSIAENIRYGNFTASQDDIEIAATMANAHGFIDELPEGYETVLGERGAQLSGGQKQRVALARALLRDPAVLLMDEATSALDLETEAVVQDALEKVMRGRTTIIIAHRLSTIRNVDVIIVLDNGQVVEQGNHTELMSKRGLYFELVNTQEAFQSNQWDLSHQLVTVHQVFTPSNWLAGLYDATSYYRSSPYDYEREPERMGIHRPSMEEAEPYRLHMEAFPDPKSRKVGLCQLLKLNSPECSCLLLGLFGCCVGGAIMPVFAFFYGEIFATFTKDGQELMDAAMLWSCMFVVLGLLAGVGIWFEVMAMTTAVEKLVMRLRVMAFRNILRQPIGWFDMKRHAVGKLISRLARDPPLIKGAAGLRLGQLMASMVTMTVALSIAFYYGWQLALLLLLIVPLIVAGAYHQTSMMRRTQLRDARFLDSAGRLASECIQNITTVQTLTSEREFLRLYSGLLSLPFREAKKQACRYSVVFALSQAVIYVMYAGAFRFAAYLIVHGIMDPSDVYRVFFALAFCAASVGTSSAYVQDYTKAKLAAQQMFLLIERKSEIDPLSPGGLRTEIRGEVRFLGVCFHYPSRPDVRVLRGVTVTVAVGQTLALVGQSGCGKSSLMGLLERFYQPTEGQITVDGIDIQEINLHHLRNNIGIVTQEPLLFDQSIRDNIAYGLTDDASARSGNGSADSVLTRVMEAAAIANCHNFITRLPQGYETRVGEGGCQLSVGQKQRIAIARALVRDPRILLFDEPTSALDNQSEKQVLEALERAREGRTCIIIAHRLSTIKSADIIAVLEGGKIREMGSHQELQDQQGLYYRLMSAQRL